MSYQVAVIGTGTEPDDPGRDGYAMAYHHAEGYEKHDRCELVACADIVPENAAAFAAEYGIDDENVFEDYEVMLETVDPDIVSLCVPPVIHASIAIDCCRAGVDAVHCEKPMAQTYGGARMMAQEAARHDVQMTFNHQRRFSDAVRTAKRLLDDGEIGELERVEFSAPVGIFDYGSHSFDLCNYFNDEVPADWVMGQIDYREENVLFGSHNENQALVMWEYENGVHGLGTSDSADEGGPTGAVRCHNRLIGTEGTIEVGPEGDDEDLPVLRIRRAGDDEWEAVETEDGLHSWEFIDRAIAENVRCLEEDEEPELSAENALNATELIFGAWESARKRGRVDLPLEIDDNPLDAMVESGELNPEPMDEAEAE
ncbi:Gfo/Idh/MocA family protein [Halopiger xanaduensis]|uniref:Oxidoreductase domain protein n=1 Tax=Halopiger xanaduensis (strain DSM 18323 / JCM 14033 / SH-6) TaxID=797210 RepID=F8DDF9_HALXS|nr:Gfo/Idh/MocA family oxidoreductase [Halopiger xanaduensis]AEH39053.1 oxidoreductase domain protein [Halopiger xanaduensis SH-6]